MNPQNCIKLFRNSSLVFISYLPLVTGTEIVQSRAILRFVGKCTGLYSYHDPLTAAHVDAVIDAVEDLGEGIMKCTLGMDPRSPEFLEKRKECVSGAQG